MPDRVLTGSEVRHSLTYAFGRNAGGCEGPMRGQSGQMGLAEVDVQNLPRLKIDEQVQVVAIDQQVIVRDAPALDFPLAKAGARLVLIGTSRSSSILRAPGRSRKCRRWPDPW